MSPAAAAATETTTMKKKTLTPREREEKETKSKRQSRKDELTSSRLFLLLVAFRASSSFHNLIHDCDETFQSWEPVHFLLCDEGVQSWELSGEFKLRSYLYLLLHAWVGLPFRFVFGCRSGRGKEVVFYAMRFALAIFSVRGDSFLVKECLMIEPKVGATVLLVLSFATGNFVSSTAMLPNSFAMGCVTRAAASAIEYLNFRATRERFGEFVAKEELKRKKKIKKAKVSDERERVKLG